jgi:hypothetical protein
MHLEKNTDDDDDGLDRARGAPKPTNAQRLASPRPSHADQSTAPRLLHLGVSKATTTAETGRQSNTRQALARNSNRHLCG